MTGPILALDSVSHSFGGLRAVDAATFAVPPRQITSLIGPNGAGKTTIFNIISGFLSAQQGRIVFRDQRIENRKPHQVARAGIGRTFQAPRIFADMTVLENVMVGLRQRGENPFWAVLRGAETNTNWRKARAGAEEILAAVGLIERAGETAQQLSFGEQRYLSIARTLVAEPTLIMMDEPTVGLDQAALARLIELLQRIVRERSTTLLLIEHNMEMVMSISDQVVLLVQGNVVTSGTPAEVKSHARTVEAYLGASMLLDVQGLHAGYGRKTVIHGIDLTVGEQEIVAVLGHNGAGKSTLMNAIFGLLPATKGAIRFQGQDFTHSRPDAKLRSGMGYSPQGAPVFATLSVQENLLMGSDPALGHAEVAARIARVESMFPNLAERRDTRAGSLSGGERQMLALGMLLIAAPRLVILDEPSGGLSPVMVDKTYDAITEIASGLRASVLLVEQDFDQALRIANRVYVLANGKVRFTGSPAEIDSPAVRSQMLLGF